jgi:hypothetical protein
MLFANYLKRRGVKAVGSQQLPIANYQSSVISNQLSVSE